jgi:hypothetical protein
MMAAKKRKPKRFSAAKAVKAAARKVVGTPPPTRADPDTTKRKASKEKYKPKLEDLLRGEE